MTPQPPVRSKAVGFDLGETLIYYEGTPLNWAGLYPDALRAVAIACNASPNSAQIDEAISILRSYNTRLTPRATEVPSDVILGAILKAWNLSPSDLLTIATESFFTFFQQRSRRFGDTQSIMSFLRERDIQWGILTDVPYGMPRAFVERDLAAAGIKDEEHVLLTSVEVGLRKPDPKGYLELAKRLGVTPHEMLYVGNEPKDIEGANRAGAFSVLIDREGHKKNFGQSATVGSLAELGQWLAPPLTSSVRNPSAP